MQTRPASIRQPFDPVREAPFVRVVGEERSERPREWADAAGRWSPGRRGEEDQTGMPRTEPGRLTSEPDMIRDIECHDRAPLRRCRFEDLLISTTPEVGSLGDRDDIEAFASEFDGDARREVFVEEELHAVPRRARRQFASSRAAVARLRSIQSSISSGKSA